MCGPEVRSMHLWFKSGLHARFGTLGVCDDSIGCIQVYLTVCAFYYLDQKWSKQYNRSLGGMFFFSKIQWSNSDSYHSVFFFLFFVFFPPLYNSLLYEKNNTNHFYRAYWLCKAVPVKYLTLHLSGKVYQKLIYNSTSLPYLHIIFSFVHLPRDSFCRVMLAPSGRCRKVEIVKLLWQCYMFSTLLVLNVDWKKKP